MNMKKGYIPPPIMFSNKLIQNTVGMRQTCTRIYGSQNKVGWFTPPPDTVGGFTILETLVATLLLALALTGVAGLVQGSLQIARDYKDSITAAMLAQEGMEMVRERRDQNITTGDPARWLDGLIDSPPICNNAQGCTARLQNNGTVVFERCTGNGGVCEYLRFDAIRGVFNYNSGSITQFRRSIHVTTPIASNPNEAKVQVRIEWSGLVGTKSLLLETHLFQWQL